MLVMLVGSVLVSRTDPTGLHGFGLFVVLVAAAVVAAVVVVVTDPLAISFVLLMPDVYI